MDTMVSLLAFHICLFYLIVYFMSLSLNHIATFSHWASFYMTCITSVQFALYSWPHMLLKEDDNLVWKSPFTQLTLNFTSKLSWNLVITSSKIERKLVMLHRSIHCCPQVSPWVLWRLWAGFLKPLKYFFFWHLMIVLDIDSRLTHCFSIVNLE